MATKKRAGANKRAAGGGSAKAAAAVTSARSTISGPARKDLRRAEEWMAEHPEWYPRRVVS